MDNVTHSLFGHALGRALGERAGEPPEHARAAVWTSVLASNAPDLDFVLPYFAHDPKLAYLLHHRGYTHTALVAVPMGLAFAALCCWLARVRDPVARRRVLLIGALAAALHVAFDFLNNYGVHPFVPFDDHWYYGDAVFIIEPLLLAALIPQLALAGRSAIGRALGYLLALALLALAWLPKPIPPAVALIASCGLLAGFALQRAARGRPGPSLWASAVVVLVFAGGSLHARGVLAAELARAAPQERVAQLVLTPIPGNPLCWNGLSVSSDRAGGYHARTARISLLPALIANRSCATMRRGQPTAPLRPARLRAANPALAFELEFTGSLPELRALRARACEVDGALRFIRAAYWDTSATPPVIGDLRYDAEPDLGFAELTAPNDCRAPFPPWIPPLADLLD